MSITKRLGLTLHDVKEFFDLSHFNDNFQKIDDKVLTKDDIVNNTDTDDTEKVMSAAVTKEMNDKITKLSAEYKLISTRHNAESDLELDFSKYTDLIFICTMREYSDVKMLHASILNLASIGTLTFTIGCGPSSIYHSTVTVGISQNGINEVSIKETGSGWSSDNCAVYVFAR